MSSSSTQMNLLEEDEEEEIREFEELEKECAVHRRGVRVKFDADRVASLMTRTTVIPSEPYFQINSSEDQVTKHFYHNDFLLKHHVDDEEQHQPSTTNSTKSLSEPDSLEEEEEEGSSSKGDELLISLPAKSILKNNPIVPRSSKRRQPSSSPHSHSNEMIDLAQVTGKQTITSQPSCPVRSLFEPTIDIFHSYSSRVSNECDRRSRLRYYIKPYRGESYIPPQTSQQRSRSLSQQRLAQQSSEGATVSRTFVNQHNRKQHVSWSPVRDYIHQGRHNTSKQHQNKLSRHSSSSPCLRTSSSSSSSVTPVYSSQKSPSSLPSLPHDEEKREVEIVRPLSDVVHPSHRNERSETMQRYDRLLEKMRATDEQLRTLSKSWTKNLNERTMVCILR